jgi:hypothetical protein
MGSAMVLITEAKEESRAMRPETRLQLTPVLVLGIPAA